MSDASQPPEEVRRLLEERQAARAGRDWERADAVRDRLRGMGWQVEDTPGGWSVRPILRRDEVADHLAEPSAVALSIQVAAEDHADDLARLLRGLARFPPATAWELVVVANAPAFDLEPLLRGADLPVEPIVVARDGRMGWADARTLGLRRSRGEVTLMLDASVEPTGELATPLLAAFDDDPSVGLVGAWGLTSDDGRQFEETPRGEVDAIEAYCLAVRRAALRAVGGFDPRFRFYRNADLDFSFAVRDAGWRAVAVELPVVRHEHRAWSSVPPEERNRLSRRNFYRYLDRWGRRPDLLVRRRKPSG